MHFQFIILGAGPSGLTYAHALIDSGVPANQILVLEKEEVSGGLCRSENVDGAPLDIGGGHFLDNRKQNVLDFLFRFLPEDEWNSFDRISKIRIRGQDIDYPLEANLWQFPKEDQVDYLESIARAGCVRGEHKPAAFADWIAWKLGDRIANEYMLPYNNKIWSIPLNSLGTYWLHKLPDVSFREILRSCLDGAPHGTLPAHGRFLYPKNYGYGEVWRRMGEALGDTLLTGCKIEEINLDTRTINDRWSADYIVSTIPWPVWSRVCAIPDVIREEISRLVHASIDVDYIPDSLDNEAHWIYEPDEFIAHHRLLLRPNFCSGSRGHWTETNSVRSRETGNWRFCNEFAYPVNTMGKPESVRRILEWANSVSVIGAGRWGKWEHMNSDVAVDDALQSVRSFVNSREWV